MESYVPRLVYPDKVIFTATLFTYVLTLYSTSASDKSSSSSSPPLFSSLLSSSSSLLSSRVILPLNPIHVFCQADLPLTCSWLIIAPSESIYHPYCVLRKIYLIAFYHHWYRFIAIEGILSLLRPCYCPHCVSWKYIFNGVLSPLRAFYHPYCVWYA